MSRRPTPLTLARLAGRAPARAWLPALLALAMPAASVAQQPPAPVPTLPPGASPPAAMAPAPAGTATTTTTTTTTVVASVPVLPPEVQVVRVQVPEGVGVELLGPPPEPLPALEGQGPTTFGLRVGVGYHLRLSNLPNRPGEMLYPVVEVVGHLHRPPDVDPGRFPIRVVLTELDIEEAVARGRLITEVIYLEDPDMAVPLNLPKDEIPIATIGPAEDPLRVGSALGRAMVIVRMGGRVPNPDEWQGPAGVGLAGSAPCPFSGAAGGRCPMPCGPARGTPPPPGRPWLPRDEYLCDGGDRLPAVSFGGDGTLRGIDPRDAVIRFQADARPRVLPTNMVCLYAPRFAAVRTSVGPNEAVVVQVPRGTETLESQVIFEGRQRPRPMTQNESAGAFRHRSRLSSMTSRTIPFGHTELRVLNGYENITHVAGNVLVQTPNATRAPQKPGGLRTNLKAVAIKTAESPVVTGIIEGAGETVMAWKPQEIAGLELAPARPGMAVLKRASAGVAEPGDVVTFSIQYRNMGSVPIAAVSVVDSLMPRLEYIKGSAIGPAGTVFTATENSVGSTELRWDLPAAIPPGAEGFVSFQARVR